METIVFVIGFFTFILAGGLFFIKAVICFEDNAPLEGGFYLSFLLLFILMAFLIADALRENDKSELDIDNQESHKLEEKGINVVEIIKPEEFLLYDNHLYIKHGTFVKLKEYPDLAERLNKRFYKNNGLLLNEFYVKIENGEVTLYEGEK